MESLDKTIMGAEDLLPVDQFIDQCGRDYINKKAELVRNPLCDKSEKLEVLAEKIFRKNLPEVYLNNSQIKNLHLGLIHIERGEYSEAFDCFKKVYETDENSLYTSAFFSFLASRLRDWHLAVEVMQPWYKRKHKKEWVVPTLAKSADLYLKFEFLFPFLKKKNTNQKNLSTKYKHITKNLMGETIKKILKERCNDFKKVFESTNDVYEFSDKLLSPLFIIKKYGKNEGFVLERKLINHYKRDKNLKLPEIIYNSNKEGIIVFSKEPKRDFLTLLENIYEIKKYIEKIKEPINSGFFSRKLDKKQLHPGIFYCISSEPKEYSKTDLQYQSDYWIKGSFRLLIEAIARLHANTPYTALKENEKTEIDYQNDLASFCERIDKLTNGKLKNDISQFKEDYRLIIRHLANTQKVLYKDMYLKNELWDVTWGERNLNETQIIDFEKCGLAPAQLDLAQILDFGNFLNNEEKEELIDSYIEKFNLLVEKPWLFYNPSKIIKNREKFKSIFDYACVHRNLLHFRSQSKLLEKGDNSPQTKLYQKISLENSIKALNKMLNHHDKQVRVIGVGPYWKGKTLVKYHSKRNIHRSLRQHKTYRPQLERIKSFLETAYANIYQ